MRVCTVDGCDRRHYGRGMCQMHWQRWRKANPGASQIKVDDATRFWSRVEKTASCWNWMRGKSAGGYGQLAIRGRVTYAHRWSYEEAYGPIPEGFHIDHLCRNRSCVRPDHLEAVTPLVNVRRGEGHGSETHCPKGHPYSEENTYRPARGGRMCRACSQANARRRRRQNPRPYDPVKRRAEYERMKARRDAARS